MGLLQGLGQAKPVSEFINTSGQYQTTQSNLETQRLQQQILQQQAQQVEKDNKEYHVDAALSLYPEQDRPFIKNALATAGKISPAGIVIGKDMREVPKLFEQYPKIAIGRGQMEYESLASENEKLSKKGDEQSQQKMLANATRMTEIKKHIQSLSGKEEVDKSFTLKPGEIRYDATGKPVASVDKEQKVVATLANENGDIVRQMDDGTLLNSIGDPYEGDPSGLIKVGADKAETSPTTIKEFETVYPQYAGQRGTPEYTKGYEKFLELKGNRINAVTYLGQNEQGDFIVGKTRGVGAGAPPQVVSNPAGGQLKPNVVRPLGTQEQEKFIGASNIAHVLPDMIPFRDLVRAKGGPIIDQVRGKAAEKMIDAGMGAQTGLPPEAINAHVAVTHLKTWATGMLKGAGSDVQRAQLIATLPTLYDSADVIDQKMRKTINIVRRIASNTIQSAAAGGKAVPSDMYRQLADMEDFANQLGEPLPKDLPTGTVDLGGGVYKLPNGKTVRKR